MYQIHAQQQYEHNSRWYNLQRATGARPVPPIVPHDCWLLNPYMVTDRAASVS